MIIRQENKANHAEIYRVVQTAFDTAEHTDGKEQDLVVKLRTGNFMAIKLDENAPPIKVVIKYADEFDV